jgi:hypothetical protein
MRTRFSLLFLVVFAVGCASASRPATPAEVASDLPRWYRNIPNDQNFLYATATAESRDMQLAVNKATADARNNIATQMEVRMQGLTKRFQEETGLGADAQLLDMFTTASKQVVSQTLNGSRVSEQDIKSNGGTYRAFVLVELPIGVASQALRDRIKANEQMYTRFRASEAFKELDAEVQRFEEFKQRTP